MTLLLPAGNLPRTSYIQHQLLGVPGSEILCPQCRRWSARCDFANCYGGV